ncbi:TIGR03826 family flagellar region protein [Salimicrobium humidisoli]|uniref:Flagellar operon protein TIGR03826 n=1 Tax=Salimicrobium humidisoli TaxID=2029857 RepID=A0ABX4HRZ3_9BACI|nr:TIGR03826 family flagellar region protein [Salimicrobium humidisoli]PBB05627.1 hypothetical protein CKW00_07560 [Salimicrobium humidisoli]
MAEPANCSRCGGLFMKRTHTFCEACRNREELDYRAVYKFLRERENRAATADVIAEATGVDEKQIRKFVKDRRLHPMNFPGLSYACERCGGAIRQGRLCPSCSKELNEALAKIDRNEKAREKRNHREEKPETTRSSYYSIHRKKR